MAVINLSYFEAYAKTMFLILNHFQSVDIPPPSWLLLVLIKCTLNAFAFAFTAALVWVWASIFFPLCVPGRVGLVAPGAIWYMAMRGIISKHWYIYWKIRVQAALECQLCVGWCKTDDTHFPFRFFRLGFSTLLANWLDWGCAHAMAFRGRMHFEIPISTIDGRLAPNRDLRIRGKCEIKYRNRRLLGGLRHFNWATVLSLCVRIVFGRNVYVMFCD